MLKPMGAATGQLLGMNMMMRCADLDATRELDRLTVPWPSRGVPVTGLAAARIGAVIGTIPLDTRPAA
jgi:hypothetical protein